MPNERQVDLLRLGVIEWNEWRRQHPDEVLDLDGADLAQANLCQANLMGANLSNANLRGAALILADLRRTNLAGAALRQAVMNGSDLREARLSEADLSGAELKPEEYTPVDLGAADLTRADLSGADLQQAVLTLARLTRANLAGASMMMADLYRTDLTAANLTATKLDGANLGTCVLAQAILVDASLSESNLSHSDLSGANLRRASLQLANLTYADLRNADLEGADLQLAMLIHAKLDNAKLNECHVYGASAWDVSVEGAQQKGLLISQSDQPQITVDSLEVAQFLYLMLHNQKLRDVIDTITSKVVLILGRFTPERKQVLDGIRDALRSRHNYVPVLFDFTPPQNRNFTETVTLLARMARFVIADLTDQASVPHELQAIIPDLKIPVQPLVQADQRPFAMFRDHAEHDWVLPVVTYSSLDELLQLLEADIIGRAEAKALQIQRRRLAQE